MKGRYYRHTNPMNIDKSSNPSYGWRSILAGKQVLLQGLRKRIRNGMKLRSGKNHGFLRIPQDHLSAATIPEMITYGFTIL